MVARKGQKHKVTNNKQETKGSNNCVGEYEKVCETEKKNVPSCINKNELILENLMCVEW